MAKFNSSDILKILRKFNIANEDNVPRNIEELKKISADEFSEIFAFKFNKNKFFVIIDGTAEDDEFYIREILRKSFGEIEGRLIGNPLDSMMSFAIPFEGKDVYLFQNIQSKKRLDVYLAEKYPEFSRATIQKYIKNGFVEVNGKKVQLSTYEAKAGWNNYDGKWYYFDSAGKMLTGWIQTNKWYYLDDNGVMQTGWKFIKGSWYYLNSSGEMQTGWLFEGNKWYFLDGSGAMRTGWIQVGKEWYYMNNSGAMQTGWQQVNGKWYYLSNSGALLINTKTPDGYYVNENGEWV